MAKEPLILIPGVLCTEELWRDQIAALGGAADVTVTLEQQRHDSSAAIARAILAAAPPRFALAGLSMGGMVAFEIMRQAPDRVSRLALLDTTAEPDTPAASEIRRAGCGWSRPGNSTSSLGCSSLVSCRRGGLPIPCWSIGCWQCSVPAGQRSTCGRSGR